MSNSDSSKPDDSCYKPLDNFGACQLWLHIFDEEYDKVSELTGYHYNEQDPESLLCKVGLDAGDPEFRKLHNITEIVGATLVRVCQRKLNHMGSKYDIYSDAVIDTDAIMKYIKSIK